ncbi:inosose dehydratase [Pedobacter sp. UYP24]
MKSRRSFLYQSIAAIAAGAFLNSNNVLASVPVVRANKGKDSFRFGLAGFSFVNFKLDDSLAMMKKVDAHYLCIKDFHLPLNSTTDEIAAFHAKLKESNVTGYAVGPIYTKTKKEIDNAFDYAKRVGVDLIIGIPLHADLSYVEEKVKQTNIRYAIHNHGPEDELYPTAESIYNLISKLDSRIGICFDIGHDTRAGKNPVEDLKKYSSRIFDMHLKNVTVAVKTGSTCELGRGVIVIPALVKMMKKVKYTGVCALEYEKDMKDPLAGIAESVGYFRGVCAAEG